MLPADSILKNFAKASTILLSPISSSEVPFMHLAHSDRAPLLAPFSLVKHCVVWKRFQCEGLLAIYRRLLAA
jgi:hypothetical protein